MASSLQNQQPRKKVNVENGGDEISSLPDDLLAHILSFLPTNHAFRTSVLSSRWKNVWTLVRSLYFVPRYYVNDDYKTRYMKFVEMVLRLHSSNVKKLSLHCPSKFDESSLCDWIDAFLKHNKVQDIEIICPFKVLLRLPISLFTSNSLARLKLSYNYPCPLDIPTSLYFPCLKVLDVYLVSPTNDLTERLFCSAPVLEELSIHVASTSRESIYNISSPFLKKLSMRISASRLEKPGCVVNIDAPALEILKVFESCFGHYILKNSSPLANVFLRTCYNVYVNDQKNKPFFCRNSQDNELITRRLVMLFQSVSTAKNLSLRGRGPMAVFSCTSKSQWPMFADLVRLELDTCDAYNSESFLRWPFFPTLKHLQLNMYDFSPSKNLLDLLALAPVLVSLVLVGDFLINQMASYCFEQTVPSCLRSSLQEVEVRKFKGGEMELNVIKYLLENAQALEKMKITVSHYVGRANNVEELKSEIPMMPRCSKHCQLVFV